MSALATMILFTLAKVLALGGIVLFFKPLLSGIARALLLWARLRVIRHRPLARLPETLTGQ
jgi:hypothetical protein